MAHPSGAKSPEVLVLDDLLCALQQRLELDRTLTPRGQGLRSQQRWPFKGVHHKYTHAFAPGVG
jgi:hypothetical protein